MKDLLTQNTERRGVGIVMDAVHNAEWIFREQSIADHGIDAHMESIVNGQASGRLIALQVKSGPSYFEEKTDDGFVFRGDQRHLDYWLDHSLPVILLLVDLESRQIYWVHVNQQSITTTGKGWKIVVPSSNLLDSNALGELVKIAINLRISRPYSTLQTDDVSHSGAKRYSAQILLNSDFQKGYIKSLASEITKQISLETWQEKRQLATHFNGRPADVVWLYLCRTIDDSKQANWLCRTQYISPNLPKEFHPNPIANERPGALAFVWPDTRNNMEQFAITNEITKSEAISLIFKTISEAESCMNENRRNFEAFFDDPRLDHPSIEKLREAADQARELYLLAGDFGFPPYELADLMSSLDSVMASYDNAFLIFTETLDSQKSVRRAAILADQALKMFDGQQKGSVQFILLF